MGCDILQRHLASAVCTRAFFVCVVKKKVVVGKWIFNASNVYASRTARLNCCILFSHCCMLFFCCCANLFTVGIYFFYCCMLIFIVGHLFLLLQAKTYCCHRKVIVACKWPFWATVWSSTVLIHHGMPIVPLERETDRERERDRQRDRDGQTETDRQTDRQREEHEQGYMRARHDSSVNKGKCSTQVSESINIYKLQGTDIKYTTDSEHSICNTMPLYEAETVNTTENIYKAQALSTQQRA